MDCVLYRKADTFRRVNCLATDVVHQCEGLDGVLWHWSHGDPAHLLVARQIIASLQEKGLVIFSQCRYLLAL